MTINILLKYFILFHFSSLGILLASLLSTDSKIESNRLNCAAREDKKECYCYELLVVKANLKCFGNTRAQRILENGRQIFGLSSSSGLICSSLVFGTLRVQLPVEVHLQRRKTRPKQGCIIYFEFNIGSFLHNCVSF